MGVLIFYIILLWLFLYIERKRFIMKKNKLVCKLLSLLVFTGMALSSASVYQNTFALSANEIVSFLNRQRVTIAKEVNRKRQDRILENYMYLINLRENSDFQSFVSANCTNESEIDSALFLSLINHVNDFYKQSNNKNIDAFKGSLLKRMILLRSEEEFQSDNFIVQRFDHYFNKNTDNLLKIIRPSSPSGEKTHEMMDAK